MVRKKREKPEDFIGWKSEDGELEVIGIAGRTGKYNNVALFKVTCTECSKDKELFPDGYFVSTKGSLLNGLKPCGCSKSARWTPDQFIIRVRRLSEGRFIVHGFAEEFKNAHTKLDLECLKDGHRWIPTINAIISGKGCPKCSMDIVKESNRIHEDIALQRCINICKEMNYTAIGFVNWYTTAIKTRFKYFCPKHGIQETSYNKFVNSGNRCRGCWKEQLKNGNGYYPERKDEQDFLYILDFNGKFIKTGRSFDVDERIKDLKKPRCSGIKNILKLRIFTATHQEIYDYEQELLEDLRERGFQYNLDWTNECFENDCLFILNKLLDSCDLEEINNREEHNGKEIST